MLFLHYPGWRHEADRACGKDRLGISHTKRLQTLQCLEKLGSHLVERQFCIEIQRGLEVGQGQASRGRMHPRWVRNSGRLEAGKEKPTAWACPPKRVNSPAQDSRAFSRWK